MRFWAITIGLLTAVALVPGWVLAAGITSHEVTDDEKVIHFTFTLSAEIEPEAEFFFDGNFYALHLPGVELTRQQLKASQVGAPQHLQPFYKYISMVQGEGEAQIRIYLAKLCSPADPQLMGWDKGVIKIDLVKPLFKLSDEDIAAVEQPAQGSAEQAPGFIPDDEPSEQEPPASAEPQAPPVPAANETAAPVAGGTLRTGNPEVVSSAGETIPAPGPAEEYAATPAEELLSGGEAVPTKYSRQENGEQPSGATPARDFTPGPSYKQFDLGGVPANSVEIRALPFRQAIMDLVADCGFNVVVDDSVDNTEVNLNFTQKELSLKSALDLLCIAYDLSYVVEDDAIVIKAK